MCEESSEDLNCLNLRYHKFSIMLQLSISKWACKSFFLLFLLVIINCLHQTAIAQDSSSLSKSKQIPIEQEIRGKIGLTKQQVFSLDNIDTAFYPRYRSVLTNIQPGQDYRKEFKKLDKERMDAIKAVLTKKQYSEYRKFYDEYNKTLLPLRTDALKE